MNMLNTLQPDGSLHIITRVHTGRPGVRIMTRKIDFSLLYNFQIGSGGQSGVPGSLLRD
jgi:hypothetical protein